MGKKEVVFVFSAVVIALLFSIFANADVPQNGPNVSSSNINDSDLDGNVEMFWNTTEQADRYLIYRSSSNISNISHTNVTLLGNTTNTFFEDNTSIHNITYFYAILPYNDSDGGNNTLGFTSNLTTRSNDTYPPLPPNFTLSVTNQDITISWSAVTKDNASNSDTNITYFIFRNSTQRINTSDVRRSIGNTTGLSFVDENLLSSATYFYFVTSRDDANNNNTGMNSSYVNNTLVNVSWIQHNITSLPAYQNLSGHALVRHNETNLLYMFGGYAGGAIADYIRDFFSINFTNRTLDGNLTNNTDGPTARGYGDMTFSTSDNSSYYFGGYNGTYFKELWRYNVSNSSWANVSYSNTTLFSPERGWIYPRMAYRHVDNAIYMAGGFDSSSNSVSDWYVYNISTNNWHNMSVKFAPNNISNNVTHRYGNEMVYVPKTATRNSDLLFSFGGFEIVTGVNPITNHTFFYNFTSGNWTQLFMHAGVAPRPREFPLMAYGSEGSDVIILTGGRNSTVGYDDLNTTWMFNFTTMTWNLTTISERSRRVFGGQMIDPPPPGDLEGSWITLGGEIVGEFASSLVYDLSITDILDIAIRGSMVLLANASSATTDAASTSSSSSSGSSSGGGGGGGSVISTQPTSESEAPIVDPIVELIGLDQFQRKVYFSSNEGKYYMETIAGELYEIPPHIMETTELTVPNKKSETFIIGESTTDQELSNFIGEEITVQSLENRPSFFAESEDLFIDAEFNFGEIIDLDETISLTDQDKEEGHTDIDFWSEDPNSINLFFDEVYEILDVETQENSSAVMKIENSFIVVEPETQIVVDVAPPQRSTVSFDSGSYKIADRPTVTLEDMDLNFDTEVVDIFTVIKRNDSDGGQANKTPTTFSNGESFGRLLDITFDDERWGNPEKNLPQKESSGPYIPLVDDIVDTSEFDGSSIPVIRDPTVPDNFADGLEGTGFTLVETAKDSEVFRGTFSVPNWYCRGDPAPCEDVTRVFDTSKTRTLDLESPFGMRTTLGFDVDETDRILVKLPKEDEWKLVNASYSFEWGSKIVNYGLQEVPITLPGIGVVGLENFKVIDVTEDGIYDAIEDGSFIEILTLEEFEIRESNLEQRMADDFSNAQANVLQGEVEVKVLKNHAANEKSPLELNYNIILLETPNSIIIDDGTHFWIEHDQTTGTSIMGVYEGAIIVENKFDGSLARVQPREIDNETKPGILIIKDYQFRLPLAEEEELLSEKNQTLIFAIGTPLLLLFVLLYFWKRKE